MMDHLMDAPKNDDCLGMMKECGDDNHSQLTMKANQMDALKNDYLGNDYRMSKR